VALRKLSHQNRRFDREVSILNKKLPEYDSRYLNVRNVRPTLGFLLTTLSDRSMPKVSCPTRSIFIPHLFRLPTTLRWTDVLSLYTNTLPFFSFVKHSETYLHLPYYHNLWKVGCSLSQSAESVKTLGGEIPSPFSKTRTERSAPLFS